jgi:hypothetical protein
MHPLPQRIETHVGSDGPMSELLDELPTAHIEYPLRGGIVGDWLVLGPLQAPLADVASAKSKVARQLVLNTIFADADELIPSPAERATSDVTVGDGVTLEGMWRVVNTLEDGFVDVAHHVTTPHSLCAWAYAQVALPARLETTLRLTTASPTQLWINGEAIFSFDELPDEPTQTEFLASLDAGTNEILIRVANVGVGQVAMMMGLQILGLEGEEEAGAVKLPTLLEPVTRRQKLAAVMAQAYVTQPIYTGDQRVAVRWPNDLPMIDALTARLQLPAGRIYGEANPMIQKGAQVDFGKAAQFPDGDYEILLQPQFEEYYVHNMRVQRRIPVQIRNGKWSLLYYATYAERRVEALEDAARRVGSFTAELAKSARGKWDSLDQEVIEETLALIAQRAEDYEEALLLMLGWVARMGDLPDFPQDVAWALAERAPLVLERLDQESNPLWIAAHLLAGQLYPQRNFADLNTGDWHQAQAEAWFMRWLRASTRYGLPTGDGEASYATTLVVLSHLVDLAHSDAVAEMAAAALDKLAYQIALHTFIGAWGGCADEDAGAFVTSARLGPLAGIARLWWGQGAFTRASTATVALACAESYTLPEIIAAVGLDRQQDSWQRRQDARVTLDSFGEMATPDSATADIATADIATTTSGVNRAASRTGDYVLASTPGDWAAGAPGTRWKVTLGPDAMIFGNHPALSSVQPAWACNYWRGNGAPVRVAQWRDVLAVAYGASDILALDFTHAYFPRALFDDVLLGEGWAMARKGNGYVALTATGGVELVKDGRTAQCEVRADAEAIWLVQMGRASEDGTFAQFVDKVMGQSLTLTADHMAYMTLRGERVRLAAYGPLAEAWYVDGQPQRLTDYPHFESTYGGAATLPADHIDIQYMEHIMRVDFGATEVSGRSHA